MTHFHTKTEEKPFIRSGTYPLGSLFPHLRI